jgi:probable HAF family extracellular repeat protein
MKIRGRAFGTVAGAALLAVALCGCPTGGSGTGAGAFTYTVTSLGTLGGDVRAFGVSPCNEVVGDYFNAQGSPIAFRWDPVTGTMLSLGTLGGGTQSSASAANTMGVVAGFSEVATGGSQAFRWSDANGNGANDAGEMQQLPNLGGSSLAYDINDAGLIVGSSDVGGLPHPVVWNGNTVTDLDPSGIGGVAYALNAGGDAVGETWTAAGPKHAAVFRNGQVIDLGTLGGANSVARDINDSGVVVGESTTADGTTRGFRWEDKNGNGASDPGEMEDLGTLGGDNSFAKGINNAGDIVGYSDFDSSGPLHSFVLRGGEMHDLDALIPAGSGWQINKVFGVNDAGQLVGSGFLNTSQSGFLLVAGTSGQPNRCPRIQTFTNVFSQPTHSNTYAVVATDADGDPLTYTWSLSGPVTTCAQDGGNGPAGPSSHVYVHEGCTGTDEALSVVTITISDGKGGVTRYSHGMRNEGTFQNPR